MRRLLPLLLVGLVLVAFGVGYLVRSGMQIDYTPESIVAWVASLGWKGPAIFVALVTFRQFLLLPSAVVLPVGGLCFGALAGALLGGAGIVISGVMKFGLARWLGRDFVRAQLGRGFLRFEERISQAGSPIVGVMTAHPMGMMSPFHWAAGLASVPFLGFLVAVSIGGPIRAGAYSFLGSTLLDIGSPRFWVATLVLVAAALLPLAHPGVRRRLIAMRNDLREPEISEGGGSAEGAG